MELEGHRRRVHLSILVAPGRWCASTAVGHSSVGVEIVSTPIVTPVPRNASTARQSESVSGDTTKPAAELAAVDAAFALFLAAIAGLSDDDVRAPSLLPGWTRAHVLSHVARSGEADARTVDGAVRGEVLDKYPGG